MAQTGVVPRETVRAFEVKGVIKELRPNAGTMLIAHQAIAGYMDAMTMPFRVKELDAFSELQVGDEIAFELHVASDQSWIDHISRVGRRVETQGRTAPPRTAPVKGATGRHPLWDYPFTNELGHAVSLADFRGQALAITFFFTRCPVPDFCPRLSRNFQEASQTLAAMANAPTNWHFLSFSFDTAFDGPAVLKAYAESYHYDPGHWSFLTGPRDKIAEIAAQSDVTFEPDNGFFNHNFRTLIIDAAGHLQMSYPIGGNLSDAIVAEVLKATIGTNAPPPAGDLRKP